MRKRVPRDDLKIGDYVTNEHNYTFKIIRPNPKQTNSFIALCIDGGNAYICQEEYKIAPILFETNTLEKILFNYYTKDKA